MKNLLIICLLFVCNFTFANTLKIGYKVNPPFIEEFIDSKGNVSLSGTLMKPLQGRLNMFDIMLKYDTIEYIKEDHLHLLLQKTVLGEYDLAINTTSPTEERLKTLDFTLPFETGGIGMTYRKSEKWFNTSKMINLLLIVLVSMLFGAIILALDNFEEYDSYSELFVDAFYWLVTTATTIGYGDFHPKSLMTRLLTTIFMIVSVVYLFSTFTDILSYKNSLNEFASITCTSDLSNHKVGVIAGSSNADFLNNHMIVTKEYDNMVSLFNALEYKEIDVIVHDQFALQELNPSFAEVSPVILYKDYYSIAVNKNNYQLLETINQFILSFKQTF